MKFILFPLLFVSIIAMADDSRFYSEGGQLIPAKESSISMQKEILYLKKIPGGFEVSVYFEFFNPGEERTEIVGFVTPPWLSYEAVDIDPINDNRHPYIDEFEVMVNNEILPYKITHLKNSLFTTNDYDAEELPYVYYFNLKFQPGVNFVHHHYIFKGESHNYRETFDYRLTTGKMWAGGSIGDFDLIIEAPGQYMKIPTTFMKSRKAAEWQILGIGQMSKPGSKSFGNVYMKNGLLKFHALDFKPDLDLRIEIPLLTMIATDVVDCNSLDQNTFGGFFSWFSSEESEEGFADRAKTLSDDGLQILINMLYALHGFKISGESEAFFKNLVWYIPDPMLDGNSVTFQQWEQTLLRALVKERTSRKN